MFTSPVLTTIYNSTAWTALPYLIMIVMFILLILPNRAAFSTPRFNPILVARARYEDVDFEHELKNTCGATGLRYLIVGGSGFIGSRIVHALQLRGDHHITIFDLKQPSEVLLPGRRHNDDHNHVQWINGDVRNLVDLAAACKNVDVVFNTVGVMRFQDHAPHQAARSYNINVRGIENIIQACVTCNVKFLIHTSTSIVGLDKTPSNNNLDMNEKTPFVTREGAINHYTWTMAVGEQLIRRVDGVGCLRTIVLRPGYVFGSQDKNILQNLLSIGRTIIPPDGGRAVIDFVPVINVVYGHLLAEVALQQKPNVVGGESFCLSNETPMRIVDFIGMVEIIRPHPGGPVRIVIPELLVRGLSHGIHFLEKCGWETPYMISLLNITTLKFLGLSWAFSSKKARDVLGYRPLMTVEQGIHHAVSEWRAGHNLPLLVVEE